MTDIRELMAAALPAEWIKLRSTRSTVLNPLLGAVITVGLAIATGMSHRIALDRDRSLLIDDFNPTEAGFDPLMYGQLAFVAFAVLAVTNEYTSGTIVASLTAVPHRGLWYTGKIVAVGLVTVFVGGLTTIASFVVYQRSLGSHGTALTDPLVPRALLGAILYLTLITVFAAAVGAILRSSALALGILFPLIFLVSPLLNQLSATRDLARYLPDAAGQQLIQIHDPVLAPWTAGLVLLAWTAGAVLLGWWLVRRRDA